METKINFNYGVKMDKACNRDEIRPAQNYVHFKGGFAYATDAHCAVKNYLHEICNLSEEQLALLDGKFLHYDKFAKVRTYHSITVTEKGIQGLSSKGIKGGFFAFYDGDDELKYPDIDALIKNNQSAKCEEGCEHGINKIQIDSQIYMTFVQAFATKDVIYNFKGQKTPIICTPKDPRWDKSIGVIMPQLISD